MICPKDSGFGARLSDNGRDVVVTDSQGSPLKTIARIAILEMGTREICDGCCDNGANCIAYTIALTKSRRQPS